MPKINNVEFLTLPQQVSKNKKDIQANTQDIASLNQTVDNIQAGISNIPMLNGITINAVGVPQALSGTNKAILLDNLKNQALIKDEDKTISWALHLQVMGSLVGDSAFPNTLVDYDINLSNITYAGSDDNRFYRIRGFSRDFTFVIECSVDTTIEGWMFTVEPTIMMATIVQPSTYYALAENIVGGVVLLSNLKPTGAWIKAGDLVISGSAIYIIQSITGNQATLTAQTGFVAPTGTLGTYSYSVTSLTSTEEQKKELNKLLATKIFNVDGIAGMSLEEQVLAQGMTLVVGTYLTYQTIGGSINTATYVSHVQGMMSISLINNTGSNISTNYTSLANTDSVRTRSYMLSEVQTDILGSMPINIWEVTRRGLYLLSQFNSVRTIPAGKQLNWQIFW